MLLGRSDLVNSVAAVPIMAAASTVDWRKDMYAWLEGKDAETPFLYGQITAISASGALTLKMEGGAEQTVDTTKVDVMPGNEPGSMASDHCGLINMNEPCVLENSRLRFLADNIYTLVGTIMIAVNPFARIDIYGTEKMKPYSKKELGDPRVESHLYGMGEAAYRTLLRNQSSTALVMSGESGAGKTETAKHLMNYIAWCSGNAGDGFTAKVPTATTSPFALRAHSAEVTRGEARTTTYSCRTMNSMGAIK